jgi:hypothetical protein
MTRTKAQPAGRRLVPAHPEFGMTHPEADLTHRNPVPRRQKGLLPRFCRWTGLLGPV